MTAGLSLEHRKVFVVEVPNCSKEDIDYICTFDQTLANQLKRSVTMELCNVNMSDKTCNICGGWQREEIPCEHACAAILADSPNGNPEFEKIEFWEQNFGR